MKVIPIPCWKDNYAYLVICTETKQAGIIDPTDAIPVIREIEAQAVTLVAILNTHHHVDHVNGNLAILRRFPKLKVYGHASDIKRIPGQTEFLEERDPVRIGNLTANITHNPGHTTGAITYYFEGSAFVGDTMFAAGCGRLFEGTPAEMHESLNHIIGDHDASTKIYFGHEYTENNLKFALSLEPDNLETQERLKRVQAVRKAGQPTTPTTLKEEFQTNPFMRCERPTIQAAVQKIEPDNDLSPFEVFRVLRKIKDHF